MTAPPPDNEAIFHAARAIPDADSRQAYVRDACGGDEVRVAHVGALLAAAETPDSLLDHPAGGMPSETVVYQPAVSPGTVVGPYRLLEQIGEGGFGVVFVAEQTRPVRRRVALKVLKPGMDSRQVVARFEAERQALALMDHPNIARVFDAGTTDGGRPYFVMELVKGVPITEFCDHHRLPPRVRLELFACVCRAVQHAHQKGIIHRDLKPSNVLVSRHDTTPVVKVIDFGVAKALGQELTDKTLFTGIAQMVGTPLYMSPEQAGMSDLDTDTRSDVYSLGVLLYELLTGTTPFTPERFGTAAYDEIRRIIREEDPPKPSTRLSDSTASLPSVAARRQTEPAKLTRLVRGELDWIVMKALEKDRIRRYETANAFALDVQRFLADEPVEACPPSAGYRLRKAVRRNRTAIAFAGLLLLVVLTSAGGVGWNLRDRASRDAAVRDQAALAVADAERLLEQGKHREALSAARRAEGFLAGGAGALRPRVRDLCRDLEMVLRLEDIRLQMATYSEDSFHYAGGDVEYGRAFREYGIDVDAQGVSEASGLIRDRPIRLHLTAALDYWADARRSLGTAGDRGSGHLSAVARAADQDELRTQIRLALDRQDRDALVRLVNSPGVIDLPATTKCLLGVTLARLGDTREATRLLWKAQLQHPDDFWINYELAGCRDRMQPHHPDEVVRFYTAALALRPDSAAVHINLGNALRSYGRPGPALVTLERAVRLDPESAIARYNLGRHHKDQKRFDEAVAAYREAIRLNPRYAEAHGSLAIALALGGRLDDAVAAIRRGIERMPELPELHYNLGLLLKQKGTPAEAAAAYREALRLRPGHANTLNNLGNALADLGRHEEAVEAYKKALDLQPEYPLAHNNLAGALLKQGKNAEAVAAYRNAIRLKPDYFAAHHNLCLAAHLSGGAAGEVRAFEEAVKATKDDRQACEGGFYLAMTHWVLGDRAKGRQWYDSTLDRMKWKVPQDANLRALRAEAERLMGTDP